MLLMGIDFWLNHLSYKNWFSDDVKSKFLAIINEHNFLSVAVKNSPQYIEQIKKKILEKFEGKKK